MGEPPKKTRPVQGQQKTGGHSRLKETYINNPSHCLWIKAKSCYLYQSMCASSCIHLSVDKKEMGHLRVAWVCVCIRNEAVELYE